MTACEVVRFELTRRQRQTGLGCRDQRANYRRRIDFAQPHANEIANADAHAGKNRFDPQPHRHCPRQHEKRENDGCKDEQ
jgi:hypothetical protein